MTEAIFHSDAAGLCGVTVRGHTGFAPAGEDILCAAVTSALRLTECAVNDVMGLGAPVEISPEPAEIRLSLPQGLQPAEREAAQTQLAALMLYYVQLGEEYPRQICVMEV